MGGPDINMPVAISEDRFRHNNIKCPLVSYSINAFCNGGIEGEFKPCEDCPVDWSKVREKPEFIISKEPIDVKILRDD